MAKIDIFLKKIKYMIKNMPRKTKIKGVVFVCSIFLTFALFLIKILITDGLYDQHIARLWSKDGKGSSQVSIFIVNGNKIDDFSIGNIKNMVSKKLSENLSHEEYEFDDNDPFAGPFTSAYSAFGKINISSSDDNLCDEVNAIGVGGDFFLFHNINLKSGQLFNGDDLMKDKVILDSNTAFALFGSYDCVGLTVRINNIPHIVQGVYDPEETRISKLAGSSAGYVFLSYESLDKCGENYGISTIEFVSTEPVNGFIYQLLNNSDNTMLAKDSYEIVQNSGRFDAANLFSNVLSNFNARIMHTKPIIYPYWENIARVYENYCAIILIFQLIFIAVVIFIVISLLLNFINHSGDLINKIIKKFSIFILIILPLLISGCGKKEETGNLYVLKNIDIVDSDLLSNLNLLKTKNNIILYGSTFDYTGGYNENFIILDNNYNVIKNIVTKYDEFNDAAFYIDDNYIYAFIYANAYDDICLNISDELLRNGENDEFYYEEDEFIDEAYDYDLTDSDYYDDETLAESEEDIKDETSISDSDKGDKKSDGKKDISTDSIIDTDKAIKEKDKENKASAVDNSKNADENDADFDDKNDYDVIKKPFLLKIDFDGQIVVSALLSDNDKLLSYINHEDNGSKKLICDNDYLYFSYNDNIIIFDKNLNFIKDISSKQVDNNLLNSNLIRGKDGEIYVTYMDSSYYVYLGKADLYNGKIAKSYNLPEERYWCDLEVGYESDFLIIKNGKVYGFNFGETDYKLIADFALSNLNSDFINSICEINDNNLISIYSSIEDDSLHLGLYNKVDKLEIEQKIPITIAMLYQNYEIKKAAAIFNKTNDKYVVRILDYDAMYGKGNYNAAFEKLSTDIITGNMPDILVVSPDLPVNTYINKGLLEDLYPYIENDTELNISDFNTHIFDLYSKDDKLYRLVPAFSLETVMVKSTFVKGKKSWTVDDAINIMKEANTELFFPLSDRNDVLRSCMLMANSQFINWHTGECYFNTEDFKKMLEFIKSFPTQRELETNGQWEKIFNKYQVMYRSNLVLCGSTSIGSLIYYQYDVKGSFGEDVTLIGFPNGVGMGNAISPSISLAMSSKSDIKEGCWEFLRYFISEEYQDQLDYYIPVRNLSFDKLKNKAMNEICVEYENNGEIIKYPLTYSANGIETEIPPMTQEEVDYLTNVINETTNTTDTDSKIINIINEEAVEYFEGRATVDEVVNRIQSRVQIYIYESQ